MMLRIKRVPTVVSNYQKEEGEEARVGGCGRNCLRSCCIPGILSFIMVLIFQEKDWTFIDLCACDLVWD